MAILINRELLQYLDAATATLVLRLQESQQMNSEPKEKGKEGELSDLELAIQQQNEELQRLSTVLTDRQMARQLAPANQRQAQIALQPDHPLAAATARSMASVAAAVSTTPEASNTPILKSSNSAAGTKVQGQAPKQNLTPAVNVHSNVPKSFMLNRPQPSTHAESSATGSSSQATAIKKPSTAPDTKLGSIETDNAAAWLKDSDGEDGDDAVESSNLAQAQVLSKKQTRFGEPQKKQYRACEICEDPIDVKKMAYLHCGSEYCKVCLQTLFKDSIKDDSLFPPKCCQIEIPPAYFKSFLTPKIIQDYQEKKVITETVDKTYCSNNRCSKFLFQENIIESRGTCPDCDTATCTICKEAFHEGDDCPEDPGRVELLALAKENHWHQCPKCKRMVSISTGCNHMTCLCGEAWCYVCRAPWNNNKKTCNCAQWNNNYLVARANEVVDRPGRVRRPGVTRTEDVATVTANLNQHCTHKNWRFRHGAALCEMCSQQMPTFIYECRRCEYQVCRRCSYNRV